MITVLLVLALAALATAIGSLAGRVPLVAPVLLLALYATLQQIPLGK